ncbi:N-methyl-L-tryptophan oxidase [Nesterenkonia sp. CL21]|uniref:N-methyl-L-tryptophan oxidase n=1 Tax=Nesterenkonia sp. CL21 TaxID=3064894 RepID=UPI002878A11A|nr:N-methyl-L-tryptophan oxidase [Nesterenkonia sp. CL21]MDS2172616.1 N-methyl-L-tryptophan oxidase [Nesterenkonia sp. CL21]
MALWSLSRRTDADIHGFDAYAPGHDRGGYGGQSRIFRVAYREGRQYVPLLQRAAALWDELEEESGADLLTTAGGLTIGPEDHPDVQTVRSCIEHFGLPHETLTATEARLRFPHLPLEDSEIAILDHSAGVLRPEHAVQAAAQQAETRGATLHRYSPVLSLASSATGAVVHTRDGDDEFDHVILCPGPWAPMMPALARLPLEVHQITTLWFRAEDPPQFDPLHSPILIRSGPTAFSCFPAVDGETVKVSLHSLPRPRLSSADEVSRNPSPELLTAMCDAVRRFLPGLNPDPVRVGSYADAFTPDQHGIIGTVPGLPHVTVLTGFSGHGFKLAPTFGEVAADLALRGHTDHHIDHLAPARFAPEGALS